MNRARLFLSDAAEAARSIAGAVQPDGTTALHWAAYEDDLIRGRANVKAVKRGLP